jgi:hypothetical protein
VHGDTRGDSKSPLAFEYPPGLSRVCLLQQRNLPPPASLPLRGEQREEERDGGEGDSSPVMVLRTPLLILLTLSTGFISEGKHRASMIAFQVRHVRSCTAETSPALRPSDGRHQVKSRAGPARLCEGYESVASTPAIRRKLRIRVRIRKAPDSASGARDSSHRSESQPSGESSGFGSSPTKCNESAA